MLLEEYTIENTKVKFYDDYIIENIDTQKEYIDNIIMNLKPRISNEWTISSVKDILSNPTYIGKIIWNRRKQKMETLL